MTDIIISGNDLGRTEPPFDDLCVRLPPHLDGLMLRTLVDHVVREICALVTRPGAERTRLSHIVACSFLSEIQRALGKVAGYAVIIDGREYGQLEGPVALRAGSRVVFVRPECPGTMSHEEAITAAYTELQKELPDHWRFHSIHADRDGFRVVFEHERVRDAQISVIVNERTQDVVVLGEM